MLIKRDIHFDETLGDRLTIQGTHDETIQCPMRKHPLHSSFLCCIKSAIFEKEWLDFKSFIIRSFLSSGCQDHIFRKCFSSHILHLLHMIFVEVNEQIKRLSLVITSFQVLL